MPACGAVFAGAVSTAGGAVVRVEGEMRGGTTGTVSDVVLTCTQFERGLRLVVLIAFADTCPYLPRLAGTFLRDVDVLDGRGGKWISRFWGSGDRDSVVVAVCDDEVGCDDGIATFSNPLFSDFPFSFVNLENGRFGLNFAIFAH